MLNRLKKFLNNSCTAVCYLIALMGFLAQNACAQHVTVANRITYLKGNDGGHYYVRWVPPHFYWFGEHPNGEWANVFRGTVVDSNTLTYLDGRPIQMVEGQFYSVPKGRDTRTGALSLKALWRFEVDYQECCLLFRDPPFALYNGTEPLFIKNSGNYSDSSWYTQRERPSNLPGDRDGGFGATTQDDVSGRWNGNDGGKYYIHQVRGTNTVVWFGEVSNSDGRPGWSNVAFGTRSGNTITLEWADIPKCISCTGKGTLQLSVENSNTITRISGTGGFGGSRWTRPVTTTAPPPAESGGGTGVQGLNGYYRGNDQGHYYVRTVGNTVFWFGENPNGDWANVFQGTIKGTSVTGTFYDVPKGRFLGAGPLSIQINSGGNGFTKINGNFGGSSWSRGALPSSLPGNRDLPSSARTMDDITGRWDGNDGGRYYIRQISGTNAIAWFGEVSNTDGRPGWANVAIGTRSGNNITLRWADVPKCSSCSGQGTLQLTIENENTITRLSGTGGFGGSSWRRPVNGIEAR